MKETTKVEIYRVTHQATIEIDLPVEEAVNKAIEFAENNQLDFHPIPPRFMAYGESVEEGNPNALCTKKNG